MKWLRTMAVLGLAVLWLPVSVHCQLEQLPGFDFLSCCDHEDTTAPHQDDDCGGDACAACAVVESGLYKLEERQISLSAPNLAPVMFQLLPSPAPISCGMPRSGVGSTAPPELCRFWQFSSRAALPPRAPSLVS